MGRIQSIILSFVEENIKVLFSLVPILIGVLVLQVSATENDVWILNIPTNEVCSTTDLIETHIIYALKTGSHVFVYKRDLMSGKQTKILEYNESVELTPTGIVLSPDRQYLAFVDEKALNIYNLSKGNRRKLIIRGDVPPDLEVAPSWSTPSQGEVVKGGEWFGLCYIVVNGWSTDGKYISFFEGYTEGVGEGIIEVQTERWLRYHNGSDCMSWSSMKPSLLIASGDYAFGDPGLYIVSLEGSKQAKTASTIKRLDEKFGLGKDKTFLFSDATFSQDGQKIVFLFDKMQIEEGQEYTLAVANSDGTAFKILEEESCLLKPIFSLDGNSIFYIQQSDERMILRKCDLSSRKKVDVAILPSDWQSKLPVGIYNRHYSLFWTKDGFLSLVGGSVDKSRLLILDIDQRKLVYASPIFNSPPAIAGFVR
ncbi:MAG: hypothetical protein QG641_2276 [Candidatus Poribacteria bacterium]|nr:hypothetical protein [Candidatus Poribacteria bacterium]